MKALIVIAAAALAFPVYAQQKQELPSAGLLMFPQTGHTLNLEEPAAFNAAVRNFLQQVEAGRWATRDHVTM